ncbi:MAG: PorP/SprF family type IX secretion system membrane protein [Muribaculaceae bacterium]|nr:PorP/SprF family type IX secretion system membrane protein [Muribaculaceae bacterium]
MMMLKKIYGIGSLGLILLCILLGGVKAEAQNDVQFTQYWAVPTYYNPAATGDIDFVRIRGGGRIQWIGIENAPKSFMGAADMPVKLGKQRIGVGLNMSQESLGLFSNMLLNAQLSYKLKFLKGVLSIGVQGGYYDSKFKGSEVYLPEGDDYHQTTDEAIPTNDVAGHAFDLSAGLWYAHKYFNIGISGLHLLQPTVRFESEGTQSAEVSQYETVLTRAMYFVANGNIGIKNTLFELQPSLLVKTDFRDFSAEVTMRATYRKFLTFGLGYRYRDAISAMIGGEFKNIFIGYSYDYPMSAISRVSSGSHELVIGYKVKLDFSGKNRNKHRSIRLM